MISKKVLTPRQKVAAHAMDAAERIAECVPYILTVGATCLALVFNQKMINAQTYDNCPINLSVVVTHRTAIGDAVACVSRMQINGPSEALRD